MKFKSLKTAAVAALVLMLQACTAAPANNTAAANTVTVPTYNEQNVLTEVEVPENPERIAVLDMAALDILDSLGHKDKIVGSADVSIDYLQDYKPGKDNNIANLGTIKEVDLAEVAASQPDVIFIGGRLADSYKELSKIAPVVYLKTDAQKGVVQSTEDNAKTIASIFKQEDKVDEMMSGYKERLNKLKDEYEGKKAIVGIYSGNSFSVLGDDGRCSLIGREAGFDNIGNSESTSTHGNEASWETIVSLNPEYIFVLDRNAAINSKEGNPAAAQVVENSLIQTLDVYKNGNIIYLAHPNVWYTAEGGIQALDVMIQDLESALNK